MRLYGRSYLDAEVCYGIRSSAVDLAFPGFHDI